MKDKFYNLFIICLCSKPTSPVQLSVRHFGMQTPTAYITQPSIPNLTRKFMNYTVMTAVYLPCLYKLSIIVSCFNVCMRAMPSHPVADNNSCINPPKENQSTNRQQYSLCEPRRESPKKWRLPF